MIKKLEYTKSLLEKERNKTREAVRERLEAEHRISIQGEEISKLRTSMNTKWFAKQTLGETHEMYQSELEEAGDRIQEATWARLEGERRISDLTEENQRLQTSDSRKRKNFNFFEVAIDLNSIFRVFTRGLQNQISRARGKHFNLRLKNQEGVRIWDKRTLSFINSRWSRRKRQEWDLRLNEGFLTWPRSFLKYDSFLTPQSHCSDFQEASWGTNRKRKFCERTWASSPGSGSRHGVPKCSV